MLHKLKTRKKKRLVVPEQRHSFLFWPWLKNTNTLSISLLPDGEAEPSFRVVKPVKTGHFCHSLGLCLSQACKIGLKRAVVLGELKP